uniref:Matrix Gla protein n=1 Tax=Tetraodon nigroviridis TaxID=99883 RepID=Q800X1_TETNG|nr:matrix Gla protein [Tetraodon nigroviridis]
MRSPLQVVVFCFAICLCVCYDDSDESSESLEDLLLPPNQANAFIVPRRGSVYGHTSQGGFRQSSFRRRIKSPLELHAETCEDYFPCRLYAFRHGFRQAYRRYFGFQNRPHRPAMIHR